MQLSRFYNMTMDYFDEFEIEGWDFKFNNHMWKYGVCDFNTNTIYASAPLVELNSVASGRDTILHEIAHIMAGWRAAHHGPRWQRIAAELGANPDITFEFPGTKYPHKYDVYCSSCGSYEKRNRKTSNIFCSCGTSLRWVPTQYHLTSSLISC